MFSNDLGMDAHLKDADLEDRGELRGARLHRV